MQKISTLKPVFVAVMAVAVATAAPKLLAQPGFENERSPSGQGMDGAQSQPGQGMGGAQRQPGQGMGGAQRQPGQGMGGAQGQPGQGMGGAQGQPGQGMGGAQGQPGQGAAAVNDETVERFARANEKVARIQERFSSDLSAVDDPAEARKLQQRAQEEMVEAIKSEDISVEEYNIVVQQMQADPTLREKVDAAR